MKNKKPVVILLPALLILIVAAAACAPRDAGALTTAASAASTSAGGDNRETSSNAAQTGESTQAATSAVSSAGETSVPASTTQSQPPATTAPEQTPSTTSASAGYAEWTYRNKLGSTVTYSENPDNPYIRLVSRQMGIPPDRLSASFWSQGAAVFVFRSADRNTDTLDTAYFILTKDMEVFSLSGSAAQAEFSTFSRQTAVSLYSMALDHRP